MAPTAFSTATQFAQKGLLTDGSFAEFAKPYDIELLDYILTISEKSYVYLIKRTTNPDKISDKHLLNHFKPSHGFYGIIQKI
jgi:hypothetical protein